MRKLTYLPGLALAILACPGMAQPIVVEGPAPSVSVSYADLDLSSGNGRQTLEGRVARAAATLCSEAGRKDLERATWEHRCLSTALSKARADMSRAVTDSAVRTASKSTVVVAAR
jgi:UrcA family protein